MAVPCEQDTDLPLFQALQQGDGYAMEELIARHRRWVGALAYAQLGDADKVEDVLQRVWLQVWRSARELRDARTWRAWLCRLVRNAAYDELRKQRRERVHTDGSHAKATDETVDRSPDRTISEEEQRQQVREAIASLPAIYREPLVLRHLEGSSYSQIAEILGLPVDTVETRLVRARRFLREALKGKV